MYKRVKKFVMKVSVYPGSALSLYLFQLIMDEFTQIVQNKAPWCRIFADDVILVIKNAYVLETKLERWQQTLEKKD